MTEKRSLYQCFEAKVRGGRICCAEGHILVGSSSAGCVKVDRLRKGRPLECEVCQSCVDYDEMGPPIPLEERGWAKLGHRRGGEK